MGESRWEITVFSMVYQTSPGWVSPERTYQGSAFLIVTKHAGTKSSDRELFITSRTVHCNSSHHTYGGSGSGYPLVMTNSL